jgi:hypothetical protein
VSNCLVSEGKSFCTDQLEDVTRMARSPDLHGRDFFTTCPSANAVRIEARARKFSVPLSDQNFQGGE